MVTHSSIYAWKIPWTEEPGGLLSIVTKDWIPLKRLSTVQHTVCSYTYVLIFPKKKQRVNKSKIKEKNITFRVEIE